MPSSVLTVTQPAPDGQQHGISRSLALGRILHFESLMRRRLGEPRAQRYVRLNNYYADQNLPPENVDQPLGINYVRTIVDKHVSYLWGQWKKRLVEIRFVPHGKDSMSPEELQDWTEFGRKIANAWNRIYDENRLNVTLLQASKNGCLYGDSVFEVQYDPVFRRIQIESILPEYFHAIWEISNMQRLEEIIVAYPIDRILAMEKYGTSGNDQFIGYQAINPSYLPGIGVLWKRWSHTTMQVWVDDVSVVNNANPYIPTLGKDIFPGVLPFVHVPNLPGGSDYWGYSDAEHILLLSDELNRRMADMGDIVNTHAHPITTLTGYTGDQNDLPVGPDAIWDLGRDGKADRLDSTGPGTESMNYLHEVKLAMQETSSMPETAFGTRGTGTSHSSGLALAMAMMPVVERSKERRIRWMEALKELVRMSFYMLFIRDKEILDAWGIDYKRFLMYDIEPVFSDILPKEELQVVNESVATYANGLRSLELALEKLGVEDIQTEKKRIMADLQMKAALGMATPPADGGTTGKNSEQGMGGSAGLPGGIGASAAQPGTLIQSNDVPKLENVGANDSV